MTKTAAIRLTAVTKRFGSICAVHDVDLTIDQGEVVALLGPNGAGKSTAIDLALGLARPTSGTALLFGGPPRDAIATGRVGAMLQGGALLPTTTVEQSVALVAAAHRHPMSVGEAMRQAGVADIAGQRVASLSGGQMQRARFAVALVSNPDLLILDEPTAAMDVSARHGFWESMRHFTDRGRTVVFATHYLDEADAFADRIVIMGAGRVVADGTPAEIKSVVSGRTVSFTLEAPEADGSQGALLDLPGVRSIDHHGNRIALTSADSDSTVRALLARHPDVRDLEIAARSMDDAFMALTTSNGTQR